MAENIIGTNKCAKNGEKKIKVLKNPYLSSDLWPGVSIQWYSSK